MTVAASLATSPHMLTATDAANRIRSGALAVETLVRSCLARIEARDAEIRAWTHVSREAALHAARELDKTPPQGLLHGIPIAVKDVIDTKDMPTGHNSPIYLGHVTGHDAACVATLRAAGAVILGKTDTTEFAAAGRHAATRNPADLTRSPGGSSAGSAAAVADGHVPLALGTQTGGSTIRPASFCGVFAFKPSWAAVSREGLKLYSVTFDTLGWFARSVADLQVLADVFGIADDVAPQRVAVEGLRIALCRPFPALIEPASADALTSAVRILREAGADVMELTLPSEFDELNAIHKIILYSEGRAAFLNLYHSHFAVLHDDFKHRVENRDGFTRADLKRAYDIAAQCRVAFDELASGFDAVLAPSARGEAPPGREPGDPGLNQIWTLLHVPCVNVPGFKGALNLPVGVTLTGPRFTDRRLLAAADAVAGALTRAGVQSPMRASASCCVQSRVMSTE